MADLFYHSSVYGDLIALDKFLIRFQHIDICFFGKRLFKTTVITASHPRLQAYEGSTGYGPDTEIREALTGKCQIWSSVREEDTGLLDLAVIKKQERLYQTYEEQWNRFRFQGKVYVVRQQGLFLQTYR